METVLLRAGMLKRFIVIKAAGDSRYNARRTVIGGISIDDSSVFSPLVKIEAERATTNPNYVHLRFCHNNKYWSRNPAGGAINTSLLAMSNEPDEDITKLSCTLFEAVRVRNDVFNLIHVQSKWYVTVVKSNTLQLKVESTTASHLSSVNWDEFVKLPKRIALKGHNDKYLGGYVKTRTNYLHLSFPDGKAKESIHDVHLMDDGHVRIKSIHFDRFWRRGNKNWIVADSTNIFGTDSDTLFWPVDTGDNTIALRNVGNNQFCTFEKDYLIASGGTMTDQTKLIVEELVLWRKIYNVRYRVDDGRVFNQAPYVAGSTVAQNNGITEASIAVEITYEESRSETFSRSVSLTAGVTTTIEAGVPLIGKTGFEFKLESTMTKEWNKTTTTTISVKATGSVTVPPRSVATVTYVGTRGTCDVPFSYTRQDQSSTDGKITESEEIDGVFTGVNAYDFEFQITGTRSLPLPDEVMLPAATESSDSEPH